LKIRKIIPNFASKRDAVKSELGLENMTFWLQTNENVIEPEASYTVTDDLNITARYTAILASSTLRNGALIMNLSDPVTVLQAS
jgi:hypothetical protein